MTVVVLKSTYAREEGMLVLLSICSYAWLYVQKALIGIFGNTLEQIWLGGVEVNGIHTMKVHCG